MRQRFYKILFAGLIYFVSSAALFAQINWVWEISTVELQAASPPYLDMTVGLRALSTADTGRLGNHNLRGSVSPDFFDFNSPFPPEIISTRINGFLTSLTNGPRPYDWQWNAFAPDSITGYKIQETCQPIFTIRFFIDNTAGHSELSLGELRQTFLIDNISAVSITSDNAGGDISLDTTSSAVITDNYLPKKFHLGRNYPNPFNPRTCLNYEIPLAGFVELSVFNTRGEKITTLVSRRQTAGFYTLFWDGSDINQKPVASGIYLLYLKSGDYCSSRKMLLIR